MYECWNRGSKLRNRSRLTTFYEVGGKNIFTMGWPCLTWLDELPSDFNGKTSDPAPNCHVHNTTYQISCMQQQLIWQSNIIDFFFNKMKSEARTQLRRPIFCLNVQFGLQHPLSQYPYYPQGWLWLACLFGHLVTHKNLGISSLLHLISINATFDVTSS